ncbi:unnamed protein product [Mytilus coruscus]|uniref:Uncharacterized protein n=1 Tax=Mytilus coruscus TaxID=42192 RepID=A0A6J8D2N6_MYTCO|nr:unnamed protein product [Mytilus coruscus]
MIRNKIDCCKRIAKCQGLSSMILVYDLMKSPRETCCCKKISQSQEKERLLKAVAKGEIKLVKLLVDGGVDVNCRGYDDKTPLLVACSFDPEYKNSDYIFVLVEILIRGGANPNAQDQIGRTPLMYAVRHSLSTGIINLLLENGADPNIHDKNGRNIVSYTKKKYWPTYRCIFKKHLWAESTFQYNDLRQFNNCPMVPCSYTDFKERCSSLTKSNTIVKHLQYDVGDHILRRMSDHNESCYAKNRSLLPKQKCKSYGQKSFAEYKPIPEENENEKQALRPCKEICFRGCETHQLYRNIENNHTCKQNMNIVSGNTKNSVAFNRHSSEEMVDKRVTLAYDTSKSSPHGRRTAFSGVSEIDKVMVLRGIKNTPAKLPPIS